MSFTSVDLPAPETPVTQSDAERDLDVDVLQVVLAGALDLEAARGDAALGGIAISRRPER